MELMVLTIHTHIANNNDNIVNTIELITNNKGM